MTAAHGLAFFNNGENSARTLDILRYSTSMMLVKGRIFPTAPPERKPSNWFPPYEENRKS